ncbi:hypothetical protein KUV75_08695 [Qipengyuania gaetbuli]|uniref:hypothetical protein n=1 Tax=Qipengyuania gaetbuli TaxID=266952 RepID=UPI001C994F47|nr:hypothetical protein [Qipengyuania gaetbuli]MBY6014981.1 hypothetical protein [Qipengyuania gaetbuli]
MKNRGRIRTRHATVLAVSVLSLASCNAARAESPSPPPAPDWDFVAFEVKSWGGPITSWRILPNGGGSWTEAIRPEGQPPTAPASQAWHEIEPDVTNYAKLEEILPKLPSPAPDFDACDNRMNDMAYGTLRLTRGATTTEIAWNEGCLDDDYQDFMGILREADEHMRTPGKAAPVSRVEPPDGG